MSRVFVSECATLQEKHLEVFYFPSTDLAGRSGDDARTMDASALAVTEVDFQPIRPRQGLLGFASLVLNHSLRIAGIAVYARPDGSGIRLVFPERMLPHGAKIELICPITRPCGELLTQAVAEYIRQLEKKIDLSATTRSGGVEDGNSPRFS